MEWFHFTDFHFGRSKSPQKSAMASLIEAVKIVCKEEDSKVDAVFITGDIAYSGLQDEYTQFKDDFLSPLMQLKAFANTTIYATLGNHDADCEASIPISWDTIGKRFQDNFFSEDSDGIKARRSRTAVFDAYQEFVSSNGIISPDPSKEVTLLTSDDSLPFDILATNTSFFADRERDSSGETTPSPIESLRQVLNQRTGQKPIVILAHHPITCLLRDQQQPLESFLKENKAVLLHGHEHKPRLTFGNDGTLRSLGFGASYVASLQSQSPSQYLNSFTHCRLDGSNLSIRVISWHPDNGVWTDSTSHQLPQCIPDGSLKSVPAVVKFPSLAAVVEGTLTNIPLRTVLRASPKPSKIIPIDEFDDEIWRRLVIVSSNLRSIYQKGEPDYHIINHDDGKLRIGLEMENGQRHLLVLIWAPNHVLSSKEVETVNTELDTEGFSSATVISIGKISSDARAMYLRLKARKQIEVLVNEGIITEADQLLTEAQQSILGSLDAAHHSISLLLGSQDLFLLIVEEQAHGTCFYIVAGDGAQLAPTDPVVARLRKLDPDLATMVYLGGDHIAGSPDRAEFREDAYLSQCHKEHNVMKYAALANVGLRFSDLPLDEVYVNASASEVSDTRSEQIIDDHLAAYPVSEELREHIQSQLLTSVSQDQRKETSQAREFCQRYSAVLITGDPGSGKTCFVRNEILAYCKRGLGAAKPQDEESGDWHASHVPIMIQLSEVVAEKDLDDRGLFVIASRLLERRGFHFLEDDMRRYALQGRIAFFFDGLDEVVSIEKRALVVKHINDIIVNYMPQGNRFVVTSRPAAVQVINLLPALHKLELLGLTEAEIRTLARRLLTLELASTPSDVHVGEGTLSDNDNKVVSQLINDCNRNPGVSRMAQNPLLLTLLIMIYANSGAPSAKRHRIYEEAIKTLASVRGREAGHIPISVQDLRERLGAIALSVYRRESGLLPSRAEVCEVARCTMERQRGEPVDAVEANKFIQRVAESTGLIALETRKGEDDGHAIVTFMHHSFLEYFAAIGLSRELDRLDISELVREPRWREILTLLAGIIGDIEDISPVIKKFLLSGGEEADVEAKLLLFAIDCALECEVPSESTQRLLACHIKQCLTEGPGKLDSWVRSEIGQRLDYLLCVCGESEFVGMMAELINSSDANVCAAAIDMTGYACAGEFESADILQAFEQACTRVDDIVLSAICGAASRSRFLRTNVATQVIIACLQKSRRAQGAAFEALSSIPSLATQCWGEIINGIDSDSQRNSRLASIAAMHAGLNVDLISLTGTRKDLLLRALNNIDILGGRDDIRLPVVKKETISKLLISPTLQHRTLGIRLLPLIDGEERYIYRELTGLIRNPSSPREDVVAALIAIRWSGSVLALATVDDLKVVCEWIRKGTLDVRVAAAQFLGCFGKDRPAVEALLDVNFSNVDIEDYCARVNALARAQTELSRVRELIFQEISRFIGEHKKMGSDNLQCTTTLLDAARRLGETAPHPLTKRLRGLIDDFRVDDRLKQKILLSLPAITLPSQKSVDDITNLFLRPPTGLEVELVQMPAILAKKCRSNVDYVVATVSSLDKLRTAILALYEKFSKRQATVENEYCITELRKGINEVTQIIVAFKDFISNGAPVSKGQ